jgi:hypothetical protein
VLDSYFFITAQVVILLGLGYTTNGKKNQPKAAGWVTLP